jgi:hypothetical protein
MEPASVSVDNMDFEPSESSFVMTDNDGSVVGTNEEQPQADKENTEPDDSMERQLRQESDAIIKNTATQLEGILNDVKGTTKSLLNEIQTYMKTSDSVSADYIRCQESQRKEAQRLAEVSPDVEGATNRFVEQQLALVGGHMMAAGGSTGGVDLVSMLSGHTN